MLATGAMLMSLPRIRMMSARLPTVIEPVTSPMPERLGAVERRHLDHLAEPTSGSGSDGVPRHGMPMFQVKRMVSNMLGGAIELASNDSEISHAGLAHAQQRDARIAGAAEPELGMGRPAQRRLGLRHQLGVDVARRDDNGRAADWGRASRASRNPRRRPSCGGAWLACSAIGSLRSSAAGHVDQEGRRVALRQAAQVEPEMHEPLERGAGGEILALHAVDVGEADRLVARHLVDVAVGIAGAQHRFAVRAQLGVGMRRRARVVRPVVHGGDAGIGQLDQAEHHAGVEVLRR